MIFHRKPIPPEGRMYFAWWPVAIDKPQTGGTVFLWLESYRQRIRQHPSDFYAATIVTTRIRTGEKFERYEPAFYSSDW